MRLLLFLILGLLELPTKAQNRIDSLLRYSDLHIHPTYKHYFRIHGNVVDTILKETTVDASGNPSFTQHLLDKFGKDYNWLPYPNRKLKDLQNADISNLTNYDQSSYAELAFVPGSVLVDSYSPYEKQFAFGKLKRKISHWVVTKMDMARLNAYAKEEHTPFNDFRAEYYFNLMQEQTKLTRTLVPRPLYIGTSPQYDSNALIYNQIRIARDSLDLASMMQHNNDVFSKPFNDTPTVYTPLVISVEGAQVLYGKISSKEENILHATWGNENTAAVQDEILSNVRYLKNLPHRMLFITLGHFAQNHVVGYAKTLDRDQDNFQHRVMSTVTKASKFRNNIIRKTYAGFSDLALHNTNPDYKVKPGEDSLGFRVVDSFINPGNTIYKKPTYIDVKHMDIKGRIQYYYYRRKLEKRYGISIPIVASHFGVSGENQAMAAATGLWPNFDRYSENEDVYHYYQSYILKGDDYWINRMMRAKAYPNHDSLDKFEIAMYRPLKFVNGEGVFNDQPFNPFKNYDIEKDENIGWFYPWSINLFDEEIIEIDKSKGIIGILMDPRQLGAFMPKYKDSIRIFGDRFEKILEEEIQNGHITEGLLNSIGLRRDDLRREYMKSEPFLRNVFYIVRVIKNQQYAEAHEGDAEFIRQHYPNFVHDDVPTALDPWHLIAIGGDYDGLIDPIDLAPSASYVPLMHKRMVVYAYIFSIMHQDQFHLPDSGERFIESLAKSVENMDRIFYRNASEFILTHF